MYTGVDAFWCLKLTSFPKPIFNGILHKLEFQFKKSDRFKEHLNMGACSVAKTSKTQMHVFYSGAQKDYLHQNEHMFERFISKVKCCEIQKMLPIIFPLINFLCVTSVNGLSEAQPIDASSDAKLVFVQT